MGKQSKQNNTIRAKSFAEALSAEGLDLENRDDFVQDDEFLNDDGSVPIYIDNCTHPRLDKPPAWDITRFTACKDCGQIMMSMFGRKDKKTGWEPGRGKVTLPVTIDKIVLQAISNAVKV